MATRTVINPNGELRHGHPYKIDPNKLQWHAASMVHRSDPEAHERERSWDEPNWARNGWHWTLGYTEMNVRLAAARRACEATAVSVEHSYHPEQLLPQDAPRTELTQGRAITLNDTTALMQNLRLTPTQQVDSKLLERVDDLEGFQLMLADQIKDADKKAANVERKCDQIFTSTAALCDEVEVLNNRQSITSDGLLAAIGRINTLERAAEKRVVFEVRTPTQTNIINGPQHAQFETLLNLALSLDGEDRNIWLAGPAGSGKTTAARKLAEALSLDFDFQGAIDMSHKLSGFIDAGGTYHSTPFRRIYENGGVILLDECDGSSAGAMLELNAALANSHASFPDKLVPRHKDVYVLAAANTWGFGGDGNYVGRNKLDAAFLDRFVTLPWPYDEALERSVADYDEWVDVVQEVRRQVYKAGAVGVVISPRASIKGAQLLRAGMSNEATVAAIFGRYRTHSTWPAIGAAAERYAKASRSKAHSTSRANGHVDSAAANADDYKLTGVRQGGVTSGKLGAVDMSNAVVYERVKAAALRST